MKVLILSHNPMGGSSNMGKTLQAWCAKFSPEELAQFYIYPEDPPADSRCKEFYRFTDWDALGWQPNQQRGRSVYQYGRRRTAEVYLLRNLLWNLGRWNRKSLWSWLEKVSPDVLLLASGDYGFLYRIALTIVRRRHIPLAVCCLDDYYLHNRNGDSLLGRLVHRQFMTTVRRTMARAGSVFVICDEMKAGYEALFGVPCQVLYTPAEKWSSSGRRGNITYLGNLGFGRAQQLARMGKVLKTLDIPGIPKVIQVYSQERDPEILKYLTRKNGIRFCGEASGRNIPRIMGESLAVIHTESFDPDFRAMVRLSVSTKIPESLLSGPCIIAYGPEGIASIDYLRRNRAAWVITEPDGLERGLRELLSDPMLRQQITANARKLGEQNHTMEAGPAMLKKTLEMLGKSWDQSQ